MRKIFNIINYEIIIFSISLILAAGSIDHRIYYMTSQFNLNQFTLVILYLLIMASIIIFNKLLIRKIDYLLLHLLTTILEIEIFFKLLTSLQFSGQVFDKDSYYRTVDMNIFEYTLIFNLIILGLILLLYYSRHVIVEALFWLDEKLVTSLKKIYNIFIKQLNALPIYLRKFYLWLKETFTNNKIDIIFASIFVFIISIGLIYFIIYFIHIIKTPI